jgi:hypothetical protein
MERRLFDPGHATGFLRAGDRDLSELETGDVAFRGQTDTERVSGEYPASCSPSSPGGSDATALIGDI